MLIAVLLLSRSLAVGRLVAGKGEQNSFRGIRKMGMSKGGKSESCERSLSKRSFDLYTTLTKGFYSLNKMLDSVRRGLLLGPVYLVV